MGPIEKELIEVLQSETERLQNAPRIKDYEKAIRQWEDLVKRGLAKERGYNLLTIDSPHHLDRVIPNKSQLDQADEFIPLIFPIHLVPSVNEY
jgi:hypothetical protein